MHGPRASASSPEPEKLQEMGRKTQRLPSLDLPSLETKRALNRGRPAKDREEAMKTLFAICLIGILVIAGCGAGPTAPSPQQGVEVTPVTAPAPTPGPCRPMPKCQG